MSTIYWLTDINGSFTNASDWSGGKVPGASDDAIIDAVGSAFTVTSGADERVNSVQLASNATLSLTAGTFSATGGTGAGANAGVILIGAGATLVVADTVTNSGTIALYGGNAGVAQIVLDTSMTTFAGGGEILLGGASGGTITSVGYRHGSFGLDNIDNTIVGSGQIGDKYTHLVNGQDGTIDANGSAGLTLHGGVNYGLVEATGSGGLVISSAFVQSSSGVLLAGAGSAIRVTRNRLNGGTLESVGSGRVVVSGAYLGNLVVDANLSVVRNCQFEGAITLEGDNVIELDGAASGQATLTVSSDTITGSGSLSVAQLNLDGTCMIDNGPKRSLTVGANTFSSAGIIESTGSGSLSLTGNSFSNAGIIKSAGARALSLDTASLINTGTIDSTSSGGMAINGVMVNNGTVSVQGGGTFEMNGAVSGNGAFFEGGGTLEFLSSFNEAVTFTGAGTLELAQSKKFTSSVTGFSSDDMTTLDLGDIHFIDAKEATFSGTASGGVLTVKDGTNTAKITLQGDYLGATSLPLETAKAEPTSSPKRPRTVPRRYTPSSQPWPALESEVAKQSTRA
jgi:hypothetical protein